jgi:hypothetical protein
MRWTAACSACFRYSEKLGPNEVDGNFSGIPDGRWAFTTKFAGLQYGAAASLAAAARMLKGWDHALAGECLEAAVKLWDEEHAHPTVSQFQSFNTTGGMASSEEWKTALELLIATNGGEAYEKRRPGRKPRITPPHPQLMEPECLNDRKGGIYLLS